MKYLEYLTRFFKKNSAGFADVPCFHLKKFSDIIAGPLALCINRFIENGRYPDILKIAKVVALHKGIIIDLYLSRPVSTRLLRR